ncbi:MAG: helix-turn-helix transcriptional regulator [Nannocystis sp.]|nr:helix-turn-helix transcriptional regulator [Nannocystis sp.]
MNPPIIDDQTSSGLTRARERQPRTPIILPIVIGGALALSPTSSAEANPILDASFVLAYEPTTSSGGWQSVEADDRRTDTESTRRALSELRRTSGLSWDQLAQLFNVSRRSVHFWASGKPLSAANERKLLRVLDIIRTADRGYAESNRTALLEQHHECSALELLAAERYDEAQARLGVGRGRRRPAPGELSAEAKAARAPLRPEELVDALNDRVHRDLGDARPARTLRNTRRGPPGR